MIHRGRPYTELLYVTQWTRCTAFRACDLAAAAGPTTPRGAIGARNLLTRTKASNGAWAVVALCGPPDLGHETHGPEDMAREDGGQRPIGKSLRDDLSKYVAVVRRHS